MADLYKILPSRVGDSIGNLLLVAFCAACCLTLSPSRAEAGLLWAPGINVASYSFRPKDSENTPNYFAYGVDLTGGYSFAQVFDLSAKASYYPGSLKAPRIGSEKSSLIMYGGELAFRFAKSVYLGLRAGTYIINSLYVENEEEVDGRWSGPGGGIGLGALIKMKNGRFWQISIDAESFVASNVEPDPVLTDKKRIDLLKLSITYVYNGGNKLAMFDSFVGNLFNAWGF